MSPVFWINWRRELTGDGQTDVWADGDFPLADEQMFFVVVVCFVLFRFFVAVYERWRITAEEVGCTLPLP